MKNIKYKISGSKQLKTFARFVHGTKKEYEYTNDNERVPEVALWKAVILQALIDLQTKSKKKIGNTYRVKAMQWFNRNNPDFRTVCAYADLDFEYVLEKAKKVKEANPYFM